MTISAELGRMMHVIDSRPGVNGGRDRWTGLMRRVGSRLVVRHYPVQRTRIPILTRIYVWSVVLEPLLFFLVFDRHSAGVTGNVSRILQVLVIVWGALALAGRLATPGSAGRLPRLTSPLYRNYFAYLVMGVIAGLIGWLLGAYSLPGGYEKGGETGIARALNSVAVRPLFEYGVAVYYFVYFAVAPRYLLCTPSRVRYFLAIFRRMFILSLVIGAIDFVFSIFNMTLLPRHIADLPDWKSVGLRFHGLAGEPRMAFVYLLGGLALLHLEAFIRGRRLSKLLVVAVVVAALATQSTSGLIGVACFVGLLSLDTLRRSSVRGMVRLVALVVVVVVALATTIATSERVKAYAHSAAGVWNSLESGSGLPPLLVVQYPDIYPLYDFTLEIRRGNFLPLLIGNGFGSASITSSRLYGVNEFANPNSQIVRIVYESGIVGFWLFIMAFAFPVSYVTRQLPQKSRRHFMLFLLLTLGISLGHRSSMIFIYLGAILAASRFWTCEYTRGVASVRGRSLRGLGGHFACNPPLST